MGTRIITLIETVFYLIPVIIAEWIAVSTAISTINTQNSSIKQTTFVNDCNMNLIGATYICASKVSLLDSYIW